MWLDNCKIATKLALIVLAALVSLLLILVMSLDSMDKQMTRGKEEALQGLSQAAQSIVTQYHKDAQSGRLTQEEAKARALADLMAIRHGADDYFWINDLEGVMIAHPMKPEMNGKSLLEIKDPTGNALFAGMIKLVKEKGEGVYAYMWPRAGSSAPVRKFAYVRAFAPWNWMIGTGIYVDDLEAKYWAEARFFGGLVVGISILTLVLSVMIAKRLTRPIQALVKDMDQLSGGDHTVAIEGLGRGDEIGTMAKAVQVFKDGLIRADVLAEEQKAEQAVKERRAKVVDNLLRQFNAEVTEALGAMAASATQLESTAQTMSATAEETSHQSAAVAAAIEETAANMRTVAGASESLAGSVQDISQKVAESVNIANSAQTEAERSSALVNTLSQAVGRIGEVVNLINDIASQTNLLALNATIEAARAGDAGKGFAVVANEVKSLANQTARATDEISSQIGEVQTVTAQAVGAIRAIADVIGRMGDICGAISQAIASQDSATGEIAENVAQVAQGTQEVSSTVLGLNEAANETGRASSEVFEAARTVAQRANVLRDQVDSFLSNVRAA